MIFVLQTLCSMIAITLHYFYVCSFAWMFVESLHIYRRITDIRDVNHGPMKFYHVIGYGKKGILSVLSDDTWPNLFPASYFIKHWRIIFIINLMHFGCQDMVKSLFEVISFTVVAFSIMRWSIIKFHSLSGSLFSSLFCSLFCLRCQNVWHYEQL